MPDSPAQRESRWEHAQRGLVQCSTDAWFASYTPDAITEEHVDMAGKFLKEEKVLGESGWTKLQAQQPAESSENGAFDVSDVFAALPEYMQTYFGTPTTSTFRVRLLPS